jgi:hypothetical protein
MTCGWSIRGAAVAGWIGIGGRTFRGSVSPIPPQSRRGQVPRSPGGGRSADKVLVGGVGGQMLGWWPGGGLSRARLVSVSERFQGRAR